jgi:putative tricarboxylic transport membrane protein
MQTKRGRFAVSELVVGLLLLAAAGVIFFDAQRLPPPPAYGMGPASVPQLIAAGMALLGAITIAAAFFRRGAANSGEDEEGGPIDVGAVVVILVSLVTLIALMTLGGGFMLGCTVLFAGTAWAFGRRALVADVVIGLVLSLLIYAVFTKLLTLSLPEGPLERLVGRGLDAGWASLKSLF